MQLLSGFLQYLQYEKRYSPNTLMSYRSDLEKFAFFISPDILLDDFFTSEHLHQLGSKDLKKWILKLQKNQNSTTSILRKIASLKSFYRFLMKHQYVQKNITLKLVLPKKPSRVPVFASEKEMKTLLEEITWKSEFEQLRNQLIIELFYSSGLRRSELVSLSLKNINLEKCELKVIGKGNKERIVPFSEIVKTHLKSYIQYCEDNQFSLKERLLIHKNGKTVSDKTVYRIVKNALLSFAKLSKNSPHVLRHTFATHLLDNGADINAVKELLGHSSLASTQVYTHNTLSKLKSIHKQAHPKG